MLFYALLPINSVGFVCNYTVIRATVKNYHREILEERGVLLSVSSNVYINFA
jgi:hypothetical protein